MLALATGCTGASNARDTGALRLAIGTDPSNATARAELARVAAADGRPGEALRELLAVVELHSLEDRDRGLLASLLKARARSRLAAGDATALADFRLATSYGGLVDSKNMSDAYALCAVTALRHSSEFRHGKAGSCLARLDTADPIRRWDNLEGLAPQDLARIWSWFASAGAKRRALEVAQVYVEQGGRELSRLAQWRELHQWWFGNSKPLLPVSAAHLVPDASTALSRFRESVGRELSANAHAPESLVSEWNAPEFEASANAILRAYRDDPALADRLAKRFADTSAYGLREAAFLSELFYRLGDSERARDWAEALVAIAPTLPAAMEAAGHGHAAVGNAERAGLFYTAAAAASGDGGATWARAARALHAGGDPLAAVGAGRRAIGLTAQGWDMLLLFEVAVAQRKLGREDQAAKTLDGLWERFPLAERSSAAALATENESGPGSSKTLLGPIRNQLGFRSSMRTLPPTI